MASAEVTEGAVNRRQRAEFLGDRVPRLGDEEAQAEFAKGRNGAVDQRHKHGAEDDENADGRAEGKCPEYLILTPQPAEHDLAFGTGHIRPRGKV